MARERGNGARSRKRGHVRRKEIADAALEVIADQGMGRFTSLAIAREVGLTDGAPFRHLATKQDVVVAAIDRIEVTRPPSIAPAGVRPLTRGGSP